MNNEQIIRFEEVLATIGEKSTTAWVYLPKNENWSLDSRSAILESDEIHPELEDEPDAGAPEFAKTNGLVQAIPVTTLQDIVINARDQKPDATLVDIFKAFKYYQANDAFIKMP